MSFEPWRPQEFQGGIPKSNADFKPADEDIIRTLAEIEKASTGNLPSGAALIGPSPQGPSFSRTATPILFLAAAVSVGVAVLAMNFVGERLSGGARRRTVGRFTVDSAMQSEAERLLQEVATGDESAINEVLEKSASWTGKTQRSSNAVESLTVALNRPDLHTRQAALQAELALDGVPQDESGLQLLERATGNPSQRAWALWMLGAIGNRGVDPNRAAKIMEAYLADPQAEVRASAVNGLALLATDETIPMMLDRFRNDPSPVVQERAACSLAESGMYTHEQRMEAAASLIAWLDDSLLTAQQRAWTLQALHDISGQNLGSDSAAWRTWYESTR